MPVSNNFPFGNNPTAQVVELRKGISAILFTAATGGVSGWGINLSLLRPGTGDTLEQLFIPDIAVSNQSQYAFWNEPSLSQAQVFITADAVWGPDEGHYGNHRFMISVYMMDPEFDEDYPTYYYWLSDRYMTYRKYDSEAAIEVLAPEKQEILSRLKRAKAEALSRQ